MDPDDGDPDVTGPPQPTAAELLAWAEILGDAARESITAPLRAEIAGAGTSACGAPQSAASVTPSWYPTAPTAGYWSTSPTIVVESRVGGCDTGATAWSGSLLDGEIDLAGCGAFYCTHEGDWLDAASLSLIGAEDLQLDGELSAASDFFWDYGPPSVSIQYWTNTVEAQASVAWNSTTRQALVGPGVTDLDIAWEHTDSNGPLNAELTGSVVWSADGAPQTFLSNLTWAWAPATQWSPESGCLAEPTGTVALSWAGSPGAAPAITVELAFNGSTSSCDGCGDLTIDGAASGTWCPSAGFSL